MGRKTYLVDETVRRAVYKGLTRSRRRAFERHFFANPRTAKHKKKPPRAARHASRFVFDQSTSLLVLLYLKLC
jgi:hypothetical protein